MIYTNKYRFFLRARHKLPCKWVWIAIFFRSFTYALPMSYLCITYAISMQLVGLDFGVKEIAPFGTISFFALFMAVFLAEECLLAVDADSTCSVVNLQLGVCLNSGSVEIGFLGLIAFIGGGQFPTLFSVRITRNENGAYCQHTARSCETKYFFCCELILVMDVNYLQKLMHNYIK